MKRATVLALVALLLPILAAPILRANTTLHPTAKWLWSGNTGWIDGAPSAAHGAVIGRYYSRGRLWSPNVGWITLGAGVPANHVAYSNAAATDFGVNTTGTDAAGHFLLRGFAYGANIGWIAFEELGNPRVDPATGHLLGSVWSANVGWISLDGHQASVTTTLLWDGADSDGDGLPDAWEIALTGSLEVLTGLGDGDGDGQTDYDEYLAGTDPTDPAERFRILEFVMGRQQDFAGLEFTSKPSRRYRIERSFDLSPGSWEDVGLGDFAPDAGPSTLREFATGAGPDTPRVFFRARALLPLGVP
jgi:hypothetical protein